MPLLLSDVWTSIYAQEVDDHPGEVPVRRRILHPVDPNGMIKPGLMNHLAAYGLRIPFLTGHWVGAMTIKNLVTNAGFAGVASRINGAGSEAAFTYIAVGTGTNSATATDTALQTEVTGSGLARVSATASRVTTTVANDTAQLQTTFSVTGTVAVTESGVLNAASTGTLLCRQTFSAINVVNGDSLQITWKVKAS
ncbi:MAG: hypothetical protein M1275_03180 [Patescibacteria group bacterium]|nr:hypothetical protein [Patescibacteria group bacterium]